MSPSLSLPPQIEVVETPDGVRYCFPRRPPQPSFRWLLYCFVILIVVMGGVCCWRGETAFTWEGAGFDFFLLYLLHVLYVLGMALIGLASHAEVELRGDALWAIERAGLFRRSRWLPVRLLQRLVVGHLPPMPDRRGAASSLMELHGISLANELEFAAVLAEYDRGRWMLLAPGYPRRWLLALAANLAHHCFQGEWEQDSPPRGGSVEVIESAVETTGFCERHDQPAGSAVVVLERRAAKVSLYIPPLGLWRGGGCWLLFSLFWFGSALFCLLGALGVIAGKGNAVLACGVCLLSGIGLLLVGIHLGRRWAVLTVAGKTLWVRTGGLFGDRERSWQREEIQDIRTGRSMTGEDEGPLQLQIHLKRMLNSTFGFLGGRNADDLAWLATVLRQALRLPRTGPRTGFVRKTKDDRLPVAKEHPTTTAKDDRIQMAKERPMRSTSFRPRRPRGE
jgi:hypothetical protein